MCLDCLALIEKTDAFCPECGAPAGQLSVSGPLESVLAQGYAYRQSSDRPRTMLLVGMWLLFGPFLLVTLAIVFAVVSQAASSLFDQSNHYSIVDDEGYMVVQETLTISPLDATVEERPASASDSNWSNQLAQWFGYLVAVVLVVGCMVIYVMMLWKTTRNYIRQRKLDHDSDDTAGPGDPTGKPESVGLT